MEMDGKNIIAGDYYGSAVGEGYGIKAGSELVMGVPVRWPGEGR